MPSWKNPSKIIIDANKLTSGDDNFHAQIFAQGVGYADYWHAEPLNHLNEILNGGWGREPPFRIEVHSTPGTTRKFEELISLRLMETLQEHPNIIEIFGRTNNRCCTTLKLDYSDWYSNNPRL